MMNKLIRVETATGPEYINPEQITRIQVIKAGVCILFSDQSVAYLVVDEWERLKPALSVDTPQAPQLQASKPDNALSTARAVEEIIQEEQPAITWVHVEAVERDSFFSKTSNSRRAMWRMITTDGRSANLFDHSDMLRDSKTLLRDSDYLDIFQAMSQGQRDQWTVSPIEVLLTPDGSFWKISKIKPRVQGAAADLGGDDLGDDPDHDSSYEPRSRHRMFSGSPYSEIDLKEELFARKHAAGGYGNETELKRLLRVVNARNFVVLDTETTGLGNEAEICQIAIIDADGKTLLDTLVKPKRSIPTDATKIHGITNDMVKGARDWLNTNEQVWQILHGRDVITYNASYDFRLIEQSEKACEPFALSDWHTISRVCAMDAYSEHVGEWDDYHSKWRSHKLIKAAGAAGYSLPKGMKPHTALSDCLMCLSVVLYLSQVNA